MDNILDCYNKDYLRKTMLSQQEIFRDQVNELHRLYNVQNTLMTEIKSMEPMFQPSSIVATSLLAGSNAINRSHISNSETSNSSPLSFLNKVTQLNFECKRGVPSSRELSICSQEPQRTLRDFDLKQSAEEFTLKEAMSTCNETRIFGKQLKENTIISCPQKWPDNDCALELTLNIGTLSATSKSGDHLHLESDIGCSESTSTDSKQLLSSMPVRPEKGEKLGDSLSAFEK